MYVAGRAGGLLLVQALDGRDRLSDDDRDLVSALASGIGQVAHKTRLADALRRVEARLEITEARRGLTQHMSKTLGRTLEEMWQHLSDALTTHGDDPHIARDLGLQRSLVARALIEVQTAAQSLATLRVRSEGLHTALRNLASSFERITALSATFRVEGVVSTLPPELEEGLYAVVFEALSTVERSARATGVSVTLVYGEGVELDIRDDGVPITQRHDGSPRPGAHFGLQAIRDIARGLGAQLAIEPLSPRGLRISLVAPVTAPTDEEMQIEPAPRSGVVRLLQTSIDRAEQDA